MSSRPHRLDLELRSVLVSFQCAALLHAQRGDDRALRWAFDRSKQLLDSVIIRTDGERHELLEAQDALLQAYRHHLEGRCDTGEVSPPLHVP